MVVLMPISLRIISIPAASSGSIDSGRAACGAPSTVAGFTCGSWIGGTSARRTSGTWIGAGGLATVWLTGIGWAAAVRTAGPGFRKKPAANAPARPATASPPRSRGDMRHLVREDAADRPQALETVRV